MDNLTALRRWLELALVEVGEGQSRLICSAKEPLEVSMELQAHHGSQLLELTEKCLEEGGFLPGSIDIDKEKSVISWRAITPESFQRFSGSYGNLMGFSALRAIHENPESIHSQNSAYLIGRKAIIENIAPQVKPGHDRDNDISLH